MTGGGGGARDLITDMKMILSLKHNDIQICNNSNYFDVYIKLI